MHIVIYSPNTIRSQGPETAKRDGKRGCRTNEYQVSIRRGVGIGMHRFPKRFDRHVQNVCHQKVPTEN